jgi:hypothetical protein
MCLPVKPFKVEREWEHAGLKCAVVQAREAQHRCAYVRVPPTHPLHGKHYDLADVDVHGGLTFAELEPCVEEDGTGWWFGFDFAHYRDAMFDPNVDFASLSEEAKQMFPAVSSLRRANEHYWTQAEVERECEDLAEQLAEIC